MDDLLVQFEIMSQERRLKLLRVGKKIEDVVSQEWRIAGKMHAPRQLGLRSSRQEIKRQIYGRATAHHIIL